MSPPYRITTGILLIAICGVALAQSASFQVSLRLLPEREDAATAALLELPAPPSARHLPPSRDAKRLLYAGSADDARRFYEGTLPQLGFHLTQVGADSATWDRSDLRAELLFHPVVGMEEATGIIVTLRPRTSADSAKSR